MVTHHHEHFESGQQKGEHYYGSGFGAHAGRVHEVDYCFRCKHLSLKDRHELVMQGPLGR